MLMKAVLSKFGNNVSISLYLETLGFMRGSLLLVIGWGIHGEIN